MVSARFRKILVALLYMSLMAAIIFYFYQNLGRILSLLRVSTFPVILILVLTAISMFINGIIGNQLLWRLGVNISSRDGFYLAAASTLANQLPIFGGILTRAVYLKQKHNLSYAGFLSATLALLICFISANGMIGTTILVYWMLFRNTAVPPILLIGFGSMAIALLIFWLPVDRALFFPTLRARLEQALEGWRLIQEAPFALSRLTGLQIALMLLLAIRYWLAFNMVSQHVGYSEVILFSSASVLTQLVGVAPGGLGVTEAIVGGVASLLGFDLVASVFAVGLDRLISTLVILFVGGISAIALSKQTAISKFDDL